MFVLRYYEIAHTLLSLQALCNIDGSPKSGIAVRFIRSF